MSHFLFAAIGSFGDLHPAMAMAREAVRQGHRATVASAAGYEEKIRSAGLGFRPLRPEIPRSDAELAYFFDLRKGPERLMRDLIFPSLPDTHADLCSACADADLLVAAELVYTASIAAGARGIPWVNYVLAPNSLFSAIDPPVLANEPWFHAFRHLGAWPHRLAYLFGEWLADRWAASYHALRQEKGLPRGRNPIFQGKHSPRGTLVLFPSAFAPPQRDWPAGCRQTNFPFYEHGRLDPRLEEFLSAGEPPVVFTLGSIIAHFEPRFYEVAAAAAEQLGIRAVLLTGRNPRIPAVDPRRIFAIDYAPLSQLLAQSRAVVHAGGIGTTAETLRAGLPAVIVPFSFDQPDNAARVRRLGAGVVLDRRRISVRSLAAALETVLQKAALRDSAIQLAREIKSSPDLAESVVLLQSFARDSARQ